MITLLRSHSDDAGTVGAFIGDDGQFICHAIELPWRNNEQNRSRIPAGLYGLQHIERSASGRYHRVYSVIGVPGRGGILIHAGNFAGDTDRGFLTDSHGCILPARSIGILQGQRAGLASASALGELRERLGNGDSQLLVVDEGGAYD